MTLEEIIAAFIVQFPIVALILFGQRKGWWVDGRVHAERIASLTTYYEGQLAQKDKEIVFRETLRQEVLIDKNAIAEAATRQQLAQRELSDVVRQSLDFNERLVDDRTPREWDGNDRRRRSRTSRKAPSRAAQGNT